jgi:hypothetical protein
MGEDIYCMRVLHYGIGMVAASDGGAVEVVVVAEEVAKVRW